MDQLKEMGEFVRSASSTIEAPVVRRLKEAFTAKGSDQPAQGSQGSQGSKPRPGGQAAPRDGAPAGGARPRPGAGAVPVPQGARDAVAATAPRTVPDGTANGSAERVAAPEGAAATGTTSAPDAAATALPRVPAPGPVTTRSARPRPGWVLRLRRGPRARARRAGKAVPVLPAAPPAGPARADAAPAGPRVPACPMAVRVPAGSRVRVPAVP